MAINQQPVRQPAQSSPIDLALIPGQPLKPTERLFIEKTLVQLYPRLQRHDLLPWKLFHGPLIPDFLVRNTGADIRRIVVIHCGDGVLANLLSLLFPKIEIVGIDPDRQNIAIARGTVGYRRNLKFICANPATMVDIPCDRIIYQHCLARLQNEVAFKKLVVKTARWLTSQGDFIVQESPVRMLIRPALMKDLLSRLRRRKSLEACLWGMLAEIGYANPLMFASRPLPGPAAEVFYRFSHNLTLSSMVARPARRDVTEWQDWGDQSADSVLGFLFANREADFTRELLRDS